MDVDTLFKAAHKIPSQNITQQKLIDKLLQISNKPDNEEIRCNQLISDINVIKPAPMNIVHIHQRNNAIKQTQLIPQDDNTTVICTICSQDVQRDHIAAHIRSELLQLKDQNIREKAQQQLKELRENYITDEFD